MMSACVGRGSPRQTERQGEPRPTHAAAASEDRAMLSFTLLLAMLVAGVVISLGQAQPSAALSSLFTILN